MEQTVLFLYWHCALYTRLPLVWNMQVVEERAGNNTRYSYLSLKGTDRMGEDQQAVSAHAISK